MHEGSPVGAGWRIMEFVQGLSEVAGHQDVAHTVAVVPFNGEAAV